jgi:hypothetical protein
LEDGKDCLKKIENKSAFDYNCFMKNFLIDAENLERFEKKVKAIQRKAEKLGVEAPKYSVVRRFEREFKKQFHKYTIPYVEIAIEDAKVVMDGWVFAATIDHREPLNIIRVNPTYDGSADLTAYSTAKSVCEHCSRQRSRKNTYIMTSESGDLKQVGSSCIKDFLGHPSAEFYAELYEFVSLLAEEDKEERLFGRYTPSYNVRDVVEAAAMFVRLKGYRSKAMGCPTSGSVLDYFELNETQYKEKYGEKCPSVTDVDKGLANKAIDLVKSFNEKDLKNTFNYNLRVLVDGDRVFAKDLGMICYLPELVSRTLEEQKKRWELERKAKEGVEESKYIGNVGERMTLNATYMGKIYLGSNMFNDSYLHKFIVDGNSVVWSSANTMEDVNVGQVIEITGTVKNHKTFRDIKQTAITRCKVKVL